jgi:predicted adenylyl cyclase CyaB
MNKNTIEVEQRTLLTRIEYDRLRQELDTKAAFTGEDHQLSYYFDAPMDLRTQAGEHCAKIWMKGGNMHDAVRDEIEIPLDKEDLKKANELFEKLGFPINIMWDRKRRTYQMEDITICLDDTRGYACIIEFEVMTSLEGAERAKEKIGGALKQYGLLPTPTEEFAKLFEDYKANWRKYLGYDAHHIPD